jgi:hypothetical protein
MREEVRWWQELLDAAKELIAYAEKGLSARY